jgi:hypothetical protein
MNVERSIPPGFDEDLARAHVLLGTVLPLLETLVRARPDVASRLARHPGTVQIETKDGAACARLCIGDGDALRVEQGRAESDVRFVFADAAQLVAFFGGRPTLPRIEPAWGLAKARLLLEAIRLLVELRVLEPPAPRARASMTRMEKGLRVRLVLELVTRAIARLHAEGWPPIVELAQRSPDRVYQWSVGGEAPIGVWLRMHDGRVRAGRGVYEHRKPFVDFSFADAEAAFDVLMATDGSIGAYREGRVATYGPPEYVRRMSVLMQDVDALLSPS